LMGDGAVMGSIWCRGYPWIEQVSEMGRDSGGDAGFGGAGYRPMLTFDGSRGIGRYRE
jgi:hypothetical protein